MIVELVLDAIYSLFSFLTSSINIASIPPNAVHWINQGLSYIQAGISIVASFTHINLLLAWFGIIVAVDIAIALYHFIMWVIKKIPFIDVK